MEPRVVNIGKKTSITAVNKELFVKEQVFKCDSFPGIRPTTMKLYNRPNSKEDCQGWIVEIDQNGIETWLCVVKDLGQTGFWWETNILGHDIRKHTKYNSLYFSNK